MLRRLYTRFVAWLSGEAPHDYVSTACFHNLHGDCRVVCKFCPARCACVCHVAMGVPCTPGE